MLFVLIVHLASVLASWEGIFTRRINKDSVEHQIKQNIDAAAYDKSFFLLFPAVYVLLTDYETEEFTSHMLLTLTLSGGILAIICWRTLALLKTRLKIVAE